MIGQREDGGIDAVGRLLKAMERTGAETTAIPAKLPGHAKRGGKVKLETVKSSGDCDEEERESEKKNPTAERRN